MGPADGTRREALEPGAPRRRSLILAGGGLKVAFQAGVLQVWLDEAGLEFDHADGASGGVFNLAMLCQGMSGTEIADRWRGFPALQALQLNVRSLLTPGGGASIAKMDRFRRRLLRGRFGLDWDRIRSSELPATFSTYNFSRHELAVLEAGEMTEDLLVACVSLPMWFPPVVVDGETYIDAVYITDANLEAAIERGADELWVIWTVSERSEWQPGFLGHYFGTIETAANGHLRRTLARIERSNERIALGEPGEFGRPIEVRMLRGEVPLHYLLNANADRFTQAVERGVEAGRRWCAEQGIPLREPRAPVTAPAAGTTTVRFTEEMRGHVGMGEHDPVAGDAAGRRAGEELGFRLTIETDRGIDRFVADPAHEARATGHVDCPALGGRLPVERGWFNLLADEGDPAVRRMLYRLHFTDGQGRPRTLSGVKRVEDDPGLDLWRDTTTLFTRILDGHVGPGEDGSAEVVGAGVVRITPRAFARQLTTFRAEGPSRAERARALARFGVLFAGSLWDVYGRRALSSSPI